METKMKTMMSRVMFCSVVFGAACAADVAEPEESELGSAQHALAADVKTIHNFAGDARYVKVNAREVKLLFDPSKTDPKSGFFNSNHFDNSCGPTAALNVFKWYGIDKLEGNHCFWHQESPADVIGQPLPPPEWVCQPRITAHKLGAAMQTNTWRLATITMPGTNTANFRSVFHGYLNEWKPAAQEAQYKYEEGDGLSQYKLLWATLAQGHPIVINYKTGTTKGHFATIVGMEKVGDDSDISNDKVYLANARKEDLSGAISYGTFRELWRRDYNDFGALSLIGERRYTRLNMWNTGAASPVSGGGGGVPVPEGPVQQK